MSDIEVKHEKTAKGGPFYYEQFGKRVAEMDYVMADENKLILEHTEVNPYPKPFSIVRKNGRTY